METVAKIECAECKVSVLMKVRKPADGEASINVTATGIVMPCGHDASDPNRWSGNVAEVSFEAE